MIVLNELKIDGEIKILITGAAGFIGSNLLEFFLSKGVYVRGLDNFSTGFKKNIENSVSEASKIDRNIKFNFIEGDIRDYADCLKSTKDIDIVLHEAALGSVQRSIEKPLDSNENNINGTLNILKASLENKVKRFIYASSSSVYGDSKILPKSEELDPNPKSIYAVSKLTSEYYCRLFYDLYGLRTTTLRYFNVFGKRQNPNSRYSAVIPKFISNIIKDKTPVIHGDGRQSRDFTYIDNVLYANYLAVMSKNNNIYGNYYNAACNRNINLNEIILIISKYLNKKVEPIYEEERKGDIKHSLASIKKIKKDLLYNPIVYFDEGLAKLIKWYIKNLK